MGSSAVFTKDPNAVLDYQIDWTAWLGTDTIESSIWTVPDGLTRITDTYSATTATIWLAGGAAKADYRLTNRITTTQGRTEDRSIIIEVRNR